MSDTTDKLIERLWDGCANCECGNPDWPEMYELLRALFEYDGDALGPFKQCKANGWWNCEEDEYEKALAESERRVTLEKQRLCATKNAQLAQAEAKHTALITELEGIIENANALPEPDTPHDKSLQEGMRLVAVDVQDVIDRLMTTSRGKG